MAWIESLSGDRLLVLAALVVAGALAGELIARHSRLPRLIGYTLAGWGATLLGFGVQLPLSESTRLLVDLALALLLFDIGARLRLRWLLRNPGLFATSLLESALAAGAVFWALTQFGLSTAVAGCCAVLAMPASAVVAGRVAAELGAEGQVTLRMTQLTALNTLYGLIGFVFLKAALAGEPLQGLQQLLHSGGLALLLAAMLATAVAAVAHWLDLRSETATLLLLGLVLLALAAARQLGASTLLLPLLAGLLLRNQNERAWVWPRHFGTAGGVLVLLLFVTLGAAWSPALLAAGGLAGLLLLAVRAAAKAAAVLLLARWSRLGQRQGIALAATLTPLSATTLVLLSELHRGDPALAALVAPVMLSALALVELAGPVAVQMALAFAGELPTEDDRT